MLGSLGVIVGAGVIMATGWQWVDPLIAIGIGLWVLPRTWILLKDTTRILLEGVPSGISLAEVRKAISDVPGVAGVHDLHVWSLTSDVQQPFNARRASGWSRLRDSADCDRYHAARPV